MASTGDMMAWKKTFCIAAVSYITRYRLSPMRWSASSGIGSRAMRSNNCARRKWQSDWLRRSCRRNSAKPSRPANLLNAWLASFSVRVAVSCPSARVASVWSLAPQSVP